MKYDIFHLLLLYLSMKRLHIFRTKRDVSIRATSQSKGNADHAKEIQETSLQHETGDSDLEKDNTYVGLKHKFSKRSASAVDIDLPQLDIEKSLDYDDIANPGLYGSIEESADYTEEANKKMKGKSNDQDEENSELVRVSRDVNADLDKYTDQDERSSLYDDYESKDVAKRGVLGSPEDYEEVEENSPVLSEDAAMVQEQESMLDEVKRREARSDARVKRDEERPLGKAEMRSNDLIENDDTRILDAASQPIDLAKLEESKISSANDPYYRVGSSRGIDDVSTPDGVSKIEGSLTNEAVSKPSDARKLEDSINAVATSQESDVEYEKRVEEQIQRKIDAIKDEIQRDIEAQRQIRDIQENNARFDELQEEEREDEETQNLMDEPIDKRQTIAKRSIQGVSDDTAASSFKSGDKKRSLKREEERKKQRRSVELGESDASKEHLSRETTNSENMKRRSAANDGESPRRTPSQASLKKKREHVRQTILMNNDYRRTRRRHSRSYTSPVEWRDVGQRDELSMDQNSNAYRHTDDRMVKLS